jgi:iron-sulfur cluster repair protein YtfE (RIC family)
MSQPPTVTADATLNQLVASDPRLLPILNRHGLDTCCGGAHSLRDVARLHALDLEALLAELREA